MAVSEDVDFSEIKTIKQQDKNLIYGYIRISQKMFFSEFNDLFYVITDLVINLCLLFWFEMVEKFDPNLCGEFITTTGDNKIISHK